MVDISVRNVTVGVCPLLFEHTMEWEDVVAKAKQNVQFRGGRIISHDSPGHGVNGKAVIYFLYACHIHLYIE